MPRTPYQKQEWVNLPSETTPVSAERLEHIEDGVYNNSQNMALKEIYGDDAISLGRRYGSKVGEESLMVGNLNEASGAQSAAFGSRTTASGAQSAAFGSGTTASGAQSAAFGSGTTASGMFSTAEGVSSKADGVGSHAEGNFTSAKGDFQHVEGTYNIEDDEGKYVHIVGGGTSGDDRKNIHTLDRYGNAWYSGDVENGNGVSLDGLMEEINQLKERLALLEE